jgi:hypothetical protein
MANICYKKKEFCICFKISKDVLFTIDYYRGGSNKEPYFATRAAVFYPNHCGTYRIGQCQETALALANDEAKAKGRGCSFVNFYKKWNPEHFHRLDPVQLKDLHADVKRLKSLGYPYIETPDNGEENYTSRRDYDLIKAKMPREIKDPEFHDKVDFA